MRTIGGERFEAALYVRRDVDDEGGTNVGVQAGVEDLIGAVRWVGRAGCFDSSETADEAGFVSEGRGGVVIGVTALPIGKDDDARAKPAEDRRYLETVFVCVLDVAVGKVEGFAVSNIENAGSFIGLGLAFGCGATGAGFAAGEIKDAGAPAASLHDEERSATGLFYVIAVCGDGQDIDCLS